MGICANSRLFATWSSAELAQSAHSSWQAVGSMVATEHKVFTDINF